MTQANQALQNVLNQTPTAPATQPGVVNAPEAQPVVAAEPLVPAQLIVLTPEQMASVRNGGTPTEKILSGALLATGALPVIGVGMLAKWGVVSAFHYFFPST